MKRNRMKVHQSPHPAKDTRTFEEKVQSMDNFIALCLKGNHMTCQEANEYRDRAMAKYESDKEGENHGS